MIFHPHRVEVVQCKFTDTLNQDSELATKEELLGLEVNLLVNCRGGEDVVTDADVVDEDALELGGLGGGAKDFIFLEGLQIVDIEIADNGVISLLRIHDLHRRRGHRLHFFLSCGGGG